MADAAAEMEEGGMVRTLKDLFAGAAGGIAQVLLGGFGISLLRYSSGLIEISLSMVTCGRKKWGMKCCTVASSCS